MTQDEIMGYLEDIKWPNYVYSPFRPKSKVYKHPEQFNYLCKETGSQFTVLTNTYLAYDRKMLIKWKLFIDMLCERRNEVDIADALEVHEITKKDMYRKVFEAMHLPTPTMTRDLHFFLMRTFKTRNITSEEVFAKLLKKDNRPKKPKKIRVVEAGYKRNYRADEK